MLMATVQWIQLQNNLPMGNLLSRIHVPIYTYTENYIEMTQPGKVSIECTIFPILLVM